VRPLQPAMSHRPPYPVGCIHGAGASPTMFTHFSFSQFKFPKFVETHRKHKKI
jgi:hypothetical protein